MGLAGQYTWKEKKTTLVLEAISDGYGWFWHTFVGAPGSCNEINFIDRIPTLEVVFTGYLSISFTYKLVGK